MLPASVVRRVLIAVLSARAAPRNELQADCDEAAPAMSRGWEASKLTINR